MLPYALPPSSLTKCLILIECIHYNLMKLKEEVEINLPIGPTFKAHLGVTASTAAELTCYLTLAFLFLKGLMQWFPAAH